MPEYPGVYVEETAGAATSITGVSTSTAGMIGITARGPREPALITSFGDFTRQFGALPPEPAGGWRDTWAGDGDQDGQWWQLGFAVKGFFDNGGQRLFVQRVSRRDRAGPLVNDFAAAIRRLLDVDQVALCLAPGWWSESIQTALIEQCETRRHCFAILDPPNGLDLAGIRAFRRRFDTGVAALHYPWVEVSDPRTGRNVELAPSGHIAGVYARVDRERGVHHAPSGKAIHGITRIPRSLTQVDAARLNGEGVNALRFLPVRGNRIWGARTLTADPEWRYVNIRRLLIFLEHSIDNGTQWTVSEPNGENLWTALRQTVADFLFNFWQRGVLLGSKPDEAFFVRCDLTTMTQEDLDAGRVVCMIGVAAVKPAEFILLRISWCTADHKASSDRAGAPESSAR